MDKRAWTDLLKLAAAFLPPLLLFQWVLLCLLILFVPCWKEREKNECTFKETSALMYVCRTLTIAWILHKYVQFRGCQNNDWPKPCNKALRCNPMTLKCWIGAIPWLTASWIEKYITPHESWNNPTRRRRRSFGLF